MAISKVIKEDDGKKVLFIAEKGCSVRNGKVVETWSGSSSVGSVESSLNEAFASIEGLVKCSKCGEQKKKGVFFGEIKGIISKKLDNTEYKCIECLKETQDHQNYPWSEVIKSGTHEDEYGIKKQLSSLL